jgi:hypothetical protein
MTSKSEVPPAAPASPEKGLTPAVAVAAEDKAVKKHEEAHGAGEEKAKWYLRGPLLVGFLLITSAIFAAKNGLDKLEGGAKIAESGKLEGGGSGGAHAKTGH